MKLSIRKAKRSDYEEMNEMLCELHKYHVAHKPEIYREAEYFFSESEYAEMLNGMEQHFVVSVAEDGISGFAWARVNQKGSRFEKDRTNLWIEGVYVKPEYRGLGIAQTLLAEMMKIAEERKADSVESMVWAFNDDSLRLFKKTFEVRACIFTHELRNKNREESRTVK